MAMEMAENIASGLCLDMHQVSMKLWAQRPSLQLLRLQGCQDYLNMVQLHLQFTLEEPVYTLFSNSMALKLCIQVEKSNEE